MKNSAIVRIVIWSAVIVFLIAAAVIVMVNGGWGFIKLLNRRFFRECGRNLIHRHRMDKRQR